jgi:hypothetical protein
MTRIAGPEVVKHVKTVWGMNAEGELNGAWRDLGVPGLYVMMGAFSPLPCRVAAVLTRAQATSRSADSTQSSSRSVRCVLVLLWLHTVLMHVGGRVEIKAMEDGVFGERYSAKD